MDFSRFEIIGIKIRLLLPSDVFRGSLHNFVLRALDEFFVRVSEEVDSARVPSTDTFPALVFNDWIAKYITVESILSSLLGLCGT